MYVYLITFSSSYVEHVDETIHIAIHHHCKSPIHVVFNWELG